MKKKLLIQSYKFPPVQVVGAQRLFHFYHFLSPFFDDIKVLTTNNQIRFIKDDALIIENADVDVISTKDMRTWMLNRGKKGTYLDAKDRKAIGSLQFTKLYHSFPFVYFTGDGGRTYIRESYKKACRLIQEQEITHILTSFRPWADHIVAYRLKKRFPHLIWIADFRDLAIDPVRKDVWWPWLQNRFQGKILKKADIITTVSDGLAKRLQPTTKKVVVVRNALAQLPPQMMTAPMTNKFTINYTGSLYPNLQSTEMLFSVLRELINDGQINPARIELNYAGKDGELWQTWASKHTLSYLSNNHGLVAIKTAKSLQTNSQINLLLSWSAQDYGGIMTAKLADYLIAARPIIALVEGPADPELNQLIEATGGGRVFPSHNPDSKQQLRSFLLDAYRTWTFSGALPWQVNTQQLKQYTWTEQIKHLINH